VGEKRAAVTAVAAVLGGVVLLLVLVTWAASIGPSGVLTGEGPEPVRTTMTETTEPAEVESRLRLEEQDRLEERHRGDRPLLRALALVLEVVGGIAVLLVVFLGARRAWRAWDARRRPPLEPAEVDFDPLAARSVVQEQMTADADVQRDLLRGGSPRNGIVECWHRFEVQAAASGLSRRPWETSSEFTLRMLDLVGADTRAVGRLAALYREARFSRHPLTEADRDEAAAALDELHAELQRRLV
jgi:hypothetical protein